MTTSNFYHLFFLFFIALTSIIPHSTSAQLTGSSLIFNIEDGIPHSVINDMVQDDKGYIWLATYGGLCKYDGIRFEAIRPTKEDQIQFRNYRVNNVKSDKLGRVWMIGADNYDQVYCYDSSSNRFWGTELAEEGSDNVFKDVIITQSGKAWITTDDKGVLAVTDNNFQCRMLSRQEGTIPCDSVNAVYEDDAHQIWILTSNGLAQLDGETLDVGELYFKDAEYNSFHSVLELPNEIWFGGRGGTIVIYSKSNRDFRTKKLPFSSNIYGLMLLNSNEILAVSNSKGFARINIHNGNFIVYDHSNIENLHCNDISGIGARNNQFWFTVRNSLAVYQYDFSTNKLSVFDHKLSISPNDSNNKVYFTLDKEDNIWVQAGGILSSYDKETNRLVPFSLFNTDEDCFCYRIVFFDKQGNLWLHRYKEGLKKISFSRNIFSTIDFDNPHINANSEVRAICRNSNGNILLGTKKNQLISYDRSFNYCCMIDSSGIVGNKSKWKAAAYCIIEDHQKNIWVGTRGAGLYKLTPKKDSPNYTVENYRFEKSLQWSVSSNDVYKIFQDSKDRIWIATTNGIDLVEQFAGDSIRFISHRNKWASFPILQHNRVRCIEELPNGLLVAGSENGLIVFNGDSIGAFNSIRIYQNVDFIHDWSKSSDVIDLCMSNNELYFITESLFKVDSLGVDGYPSGFEHCDPNNTLPYKNIMSIQNDLDHNIWLTSDNSISKYSPHSKEFESFNYIPWKLSKSYFSEAARLLLDDGEIVFGYSSGILCFSPAQIKPNSFSPYIALTNFRITDKRKQHDQSKINQYVDSDTCVYLNYAQNSFKIEFSALDYVNPEKVRYSYLLEGFDDYWNHANGERSATYTNLPYGSYTFRVKSTNSQGVWCNNERTISIIITPPFWKTGLAYAFYFILLIGLVTYINMLCLTFYKLKENVKMEKKMAEIKLKFFTDISHEIRTPLTLIAAPIDHLIEDQSTPDRTKKQLQLVYQNIQRMMHLVNQALDFRKVQKQNLCIVKLNLRESLEKICNDFQLAAEEKNITLQLCYAASETTLWLDKDGLDKVMMNLLSNAFKYTSSGKNIFVNVRDSNGFVVIEVEDEGVGIDKKHLSKLFDRFYQFNKNSENPSSGIGLSIVKEIIEKHNGKISVSSTPNQGTTFTVLFKRGHLHFDNKVDYDTTSFENSYDENMQVATPLAVEMVEAESKYQILVVEDDAELRSFIKEIISDKYLVHEAENGEEGLVMARNNSIDFIVSDIMMPKMDGFSLLKEIRNDIELCHIPFVMLTAKANIESKLEGLNYGADDYITKPFNTSFFRARINNIIQQRTLIQKSFANSFISNGIVESNFKHNIMRRDEEIFILINNAIDANLVNGDFTIDELAEIVGINRNALYNKIKSITGMTPVKFIREVRLDRAGQKLLQSNLLVKEIAYDCGFSDLKYFGKCFKEKFGVSPAEYRKVD